MYSSTKNIYNIMCIMIIMFLQNILFMRCATCRCYLDEYWYDRLSKRCYIDAYWSDRLSGVVTLTRIGMIVCQGVVTLTRIGLIGCQGERRNVYMWNVQMRVVNARHV